MFRRDSLLERLVAGDRTHAAGGVLLPLDLLRSVVDFAASYAKLEKLLFGGTRVLYSSSALGLDLSLAGDVVAQAEKLAEAERARFDLPAGPILELGYLIEDQGVKIIPRAFPRDSPAQGAFFFDSELGPCIVLDACAPPAERDYILAHHYGHFLADYDPYITTICGRPDAEKLQDPRELRAHQFALAYLMPRSDFETYRDAMGVAAGNPIPPELVRQLRVYFDLDVEIVFWRLLSLGWIDAQRIEVLLRENSGLVGDLRGAPEDPGLGRLVPERLVHLVASAFGRGLIELQEAAEYLGTNLLEAKRILDQFHYDDQEGSAGAALAARGSAAGAQATSVPVTGRAQIAGPAIRTPPRPNPN